MSDKHPHPNPSPSKATLLTKTPDGEGLKIAPYPGLRSYQEDEQDNFFGRDADCDILLDKLLANRLTLLFAASGVGKSSLLNAAVLPRLKDPFGENLSVVCYSDWVSHPLEGVFTAIEQAVPAAVNFKGRHSLPELLAFCCLFIRHPFVLILDQFEELFRYQRGTDDFGAFVDQLTRIILDTNLPVNVVISMREDFALELNAFKPKLPTLLFENYYRLERMTRETAEQAIIEPLQPLGFRYESGLLQALLDDLSKREREGEGLPHETQVKHETVEPPYLQIVCARLWELNRGNADKTIKLASYEKAGRDRGILHNFLQQALAGFSESEKSVVSKAFDYLAARRGVKMAYPLDVLAQITGVKAGKLQPVLEKLAGSGVRILRAQERAGVEWYELYHDMFSGSVERWNNDWKARQLRRARWRNGLGLVVFVALTALLVDGYMWVSRNYFPADYMFQLQKFRLMDWGLLAEPLPEMVEIPMPDGEVRIGEYDEALAENYNGQLKSSGSYARQNFGNPVITVSIDQPFSAGKYEVTYEQYDYYVWQQHGIGGLEDKVIYPTGATRDNRRGNKAVTQVSWQEAVKYTEWLSDKTGETYRLPTEAEWEYFARAGSDKAFWWGDDPQPGVANCDGCGSQWDNQFIAPVGSFAANEFNLHDTAGNVWEWTCSEWKTELAREANRCADTDMVSDYRVIRGGSWKDWPVWLHSSFRLKNDVVNSSGHIGLRVIRLSSPSM